MKVIYISELVGKPGVFTFRKSIEELKKRYRWDFMIVNCNGATGGNGLGRTHAAYIHKLGADVITLGKCCYYKKDLTGNMDKTPYVLRPENLNPDSPGIGAKVFKIKSSSEKIAAAVFLGQNCFNRLHANSPFISLPRVTEQLRKQTPYIVIDFHAQASAEKKTFFYAADGLCSAVIGSAGRVQTSDEKIYPAGTACICDAGRTGSSQSAGGSAISSKIREYKTGIPDWTKDAWEELEIQGVFIDIGKDGKSRSIERIKIPVENI